MIVSSNSKINETKDKIRKDADKISKDENFEYEIARIKLIAGAIGIWPFFPESYTVFDAMKKKIKVFTLYILLSFLLVPGYLHIFVEERSFSRRIQKLGAMILNTMAVIKYTVLLRRSEKIKRVIEQLEQDWQNIWNEDHRDIMKRSVEVGQKLAKVCTGTFLAGAISFRLIKTLCTPTITLPSGIKIKPLPSPVHRTLLNIDLSASPVYEFVFLFQLVSSAAVHSTTITTFCFASVLVTHACGLMDIVMYMMESLIDNEDDTSTLKNEKTGYEERLQCVIELHLQVLKFVVQIENLMGEIFLVDVIGGTLTLCLTGYYFVMDFQQNDGVGIIVYFIMVVSLIDLIFTYCYIGELLTEKGSQIGSKCYLVNWHQLTGKKGLALALIIRITHNPLKITAGKMITLSLYNFGGIMKSAVGYLNLLRTVAA